MIAADGRNAQYPYLLVFSCHWVRHRALDSPATRALPRVSHEIVMVPFYTLTPALPQKPIQTVPPPTHPSQTAVVLGRWNSKQNCTPPATSA